MHLLCICYYIYYYISTTSPACILSCFSCVWLFATLWTIAHQVPLFMKFSRQEYWSGLLFPTPGNLPDPGIKPASPVSPVLAGGFLPLVPPGFLPLAHYYTLLYERDLKRTHCIAQGTIFNILQ